MNTWRLPKSKKKQQRKNILLPYFCSVQKWEAISCIYMSNFLQRKEVVPWVILLHITFYIILSTGTWVILFYPWFSEIPSYFTNLEPLHWMTKTHILLLFVLKPPHSDVRFCKTCLAIWKSSEVLCTLLSILVSKLLCCGKLRGF